MLISTPPSKTFANSVSGEIEQSLKCKVFLKNIHLAQFEHVKAIILLCKSIGITS